MLNERLNSLGYKALYIRPVFLLIEIVNEYFHKDLNLLSPRRARVSKKTSNNKASKLIFKLPKALLGYTYLLITYFYMYSLSRTHILICDRYFYQFIYDLYGIYSETLIKMIPKPDKVFFLKGDLDLSYSRMTSDFDVSVGRDYYLGALNLYNVLSRKYAFVEIKAGLGTKVISDSIFDSLKEDLRIAYEKS